MFTKEELLVIEDALKIADEKYIKLLDESKNNKNKMVAFFENCAILIKDNTLKRRVHCGR